MKIKLSAIEQDHTIQCREEIDLVTVGEYAEAMRGGDEFPPIVLYGTKKRAWIGDGWTRTLAAAENNYTEIEAEIRQGGRVDALQHALSANAKHGKRRTNADKRRCVKIALKEFPKLSARAIAKMCGVSKTTVEKYQPQVATLATSTVTGQDGKEYPAKKNGNGKKKPNEPRSEHAGEKEMEGKKNGKKKPVVVEGPPSAGMQFAQLAIWQLEQIAQDDTERENAFNYVKEWIDEQSD